MPDPDTLTDPRRRRLLFRAWHRGTREADLLIGGFVSRHIAAMDDAELLALERVLDCPDADLADWLTGRRPVPPDRAEDLLERMVAECSAAGAGIPPGITPGAGRP
jgi:antitoxin CptB